MHFTDTLLRWFEEHQRDLPWRGQTDPYKIWVSEIILQQTRVQQGWNYYLRFIDAFPTVQSLAEAPEEKVLRLWQGLGYYSRARNMHFAAQQIVNEYDGVFPAQYENIRKLKGVGDYTAAAIASIAFSLPYPAVDGNVLRIISRIFGICDDIALTTTKIRITDICQKWISKLQPGLFNQACMDFGAVWCTPQHPQCDGCPFQRDCYAFAHGMTDTLPIKINRIVKKERFFLFTCYLSDNQTIIEQRTGKDIWRNMYQFPMQEIEEVAVHATGITMKEVLTHQIIHATFRVVCAPLPALQAKQKIVSVNTLSQYPMPKIMTQFIHKHLEDGRSQS